MSDVRDQVPYVWAGAVLVREERSVQVSEKFTASNGVDITITPEGTDTFLLGKGGIIRGGDRRWTVATGNKDGIDALREFFLHERDQELGRWRDPNDRDFVVYPSACIGEPGKPAARVLNEENGLSALCKREDETQYTAAGAYFAAHPLPKPAWHDAKPGEVWALTYEGVEQAWGAGFENFTVGQFVFACGESRISVNDSEITAGRRIWPEVVES